MKTKTIPMALLLACAAGCSQEAPSLPASTPAAASPPAVASAPVAVVPQAGQSPASIGDAVFSITPGSFRVCDAGSGAIASTARWDVTARNIAEVSIFVIDAKGERKLWLDGGASGESTTGEWVFPDTTFQLVERGSGNAIALLTVKTTPCN